MKVTGYQLREAIKRATKRADLSRRVFQESATAFADEKKDPLAAGTAFEQRGIDVAELQALQQQYNHSVVLPAICLRGKPMTLAVAVKLVGHAGALEKEWGNMAAAKRERYGRDPATERDNTKTYATKLVTPELALAQAEQHGGYAARLRAAIAVANNTVIDLDCNPELLQ